MPPILDVPPGSRMISNAPAGAVPTILALLDVSSLLRMLSPQVTSALMRAWGPVGETGAVVGLVGVVPTGVCVPVVVGVVVEVDVDPGREMVPSALMFSNNTTCRIERWSGLPWL